MPTIKASLGAGEVQLVRAMHGQVCRQSVLVQVLRKLGWRESHALTVKDGSGAKETAATTVLWESHTNS